MMDVMLLRAGLTQGVTDSAALMGADMATGLSEQYGEPPFTAEAYGIKDFVHLGCA